MPRRFAILASLPIAAVALACSSERKPELAPDVYRQVVTAFYVGLSAMQTTQEVLARQKFDRVVALAPGEPAGFANLGVLLLRQQELEQGAQQLARAAALAPDSAAIQRLQALAESRRGNLAEAHPALAAGAGARPDRIWRPPTRSRSTPSGRADRQNDAEAQRILEQLVARSENLAARLEYVRIAAKRGDQAALNAAIAPLTAASREWPPEAQEQLKALQAAAAENARAAAVRVAFLKNVLLREPVYRGALAEISTPRAEVGQPLTRFLRLKNPEPQPAPADDGAGVRDRDRAGRTGPALRGSARSR